VFFSDLDELTPWKVVLSNSARRLSSVERN